MMAKRSLLKSSISSSTQERTLEDQRGFTLFEILIVVAILAALVALGLPRLNRTSTNIKSVTRNLTVLIKEIRHEARMKNATYRLAINLGENDDRYWVEASNIPVMITSKEEELEKDENGKVKSPFQKATKPIKKEKYLPNGLQFKSVETATKPDPVSKGTTYIHFSPEGLVEQSIIQITDGKQATWSLILNPLTGHSDIVEKPIALKELSTE